MGNQEGWEVGVVAAFSEPGEHAGNEVHREGLLATFDCVVRVPGRWGWEAGRQGHAGHATLEMPIKHPWSCRRGGGCHPEVLGQTQAGTQVTGIEVAFQVSVTWENRERQEGKQHLMT